MKKTAVGTWAFMFEETPIQFADVPQGLVELGLDGFELGAFGHHPTPESVPPGEARAQLRASWEDLGLECYGLAGDLWEERLLTARSTASYMAKFHAILQFAVDLSIPGVRVDTTEDPWVLGDVEGEEQPPLNPKQYGNLTSRPRVKHHDALNRVCQTWAQCAREAEAAGKRLLWEPEPGFALNTMSDIERVLDGVKHDNFSIMADACHAHHIAELGSRQPTQEKLPGGIGEFFRRLKGKVGRVHIIDSDGGINEHHTSNHTPLFDGNLDFGAFMPNLAACSGDDVWTLDLCFFQDAWKSLEQCKDGLDQLIQQYG